MEVKNNRVQSRAAIKYCTFSITKKDNIEI